MPFDSDEQRRAFFATHPNAAGHPQGPLGAQASKRKPSATPEHEGEYFHGTTQEFDQFNDPGEGKGIWLTTNQADAQRYADMGARYGGMARVIRAKVALQRDGTKRMEELSRHVYETNDGDPETRRLFRV